MIGVTRYCVGCSFCRLVCPTGAIDVMGKAEINHELGIECRKCVDYCPLEALRVIE